MNLKQWESNGWLTPHKTSGKEIAALLAIVDRDLRDSEGDISADWRFGIAYNAALKLCTILLCAEGYRPAHGTHHYRAILAMPLIIGPGGRDDAEYLDMCRNKRNTVEYDSAGAASEDEAVELAAFAKELRKSVLNWLETKHPELLAEVK